LQERDTLKRVALVTVDATDARGGAEILTVALARALADQGLEVGLLTTPPRDGSSLGGPADMLTAFARPRFGMTAIKLLHVDPWVLIESWRFFRRFRPDLVHLHSFYSLSLAPVLAARLCRIPVVATLHDYWPICFRNRFCFDGTAMCAGFRVARCTPCVVEALTESRWLRRFGGIMGRPVLALMAAVRRALAKQVAHFVVFSTAAVAYLQTVQVPNNRISVVMQSVPALSAPLPEQQSTAPEILYVGRLDWQKGLPTLLEAFATARSYCPAARLVCVGEGPLRQALQETASKHGLSEAVDFRGWVPRDALATLYARARVCVVPSLAEMAPLVPLEALSFGTPVIVTDLKGGREYFDDKAIWIVPPGDAQALAVALRAAVAEDPVAYSARRAASKRLSQRWPWSAHVAGTMKVYMQALGQPSLPHSSGDAVFGKAPAVPVDETAVR